jgi:peptide/nickel transport system substrate-binding protein
LLADAQRMIWETCPMMWSFVPKVVLARRDRIGNVGLRPTNSYDLSAATLTA